MLLDRSQDRVLTNVEVKQLLAEDAENEDAEFKALMKGWDNLLAKDKFPRTGDMESKEKIRAWKEGQTYFFRDSCNVVRFTQSFTAECCDAYFKQCWLARMPTKNQLEGLSMSEIEDACDKFYLVALPIKVLLDSGFYLDLIMYQEFLHSFNKPV